MPPGGAERIAARAYSRRLDRSPLSTVTPAASPAASPTLWLAGEFVSVIGPTGCGKSTLLNER
jgi:ABC-type multidrug transport system fused ATPase/permease subunit